MSMLIRLDNVTLGYERHPAVHHLSGDIRAGSLTAVVGPNGAGKSTLLKGIKGVLPVLSGRIERGVDKKRIAYLPQQAEIDPHFPISVLDTVLLGHWRRVGPFRGMGRAERHEAEHALDAVGLPGFEARPFGSLSVGQRQRVLFARVLLEDSPVILLDEPFAAIDSRSTADLLDIVARWGAENRTVLAVLHDFEQVRAHFPETLLLAREKVAWGATGTVLTPENLSRAKVMAEDWDDHAPVCLRGAEP
jgi:zinc/manganese transport system ATP-binding protein